MTQGSQHRSYMSLKIVLYNAYVACGFRFSSPSDQGEGPGDQQRHTKYFRLTRLVWGAGLQMHHSFQAYPTAVPTHADVSHVCVYSMYYTKSASVLQKLLSVA